MRLRLLIALSLAVAGCSSDEEGLPVTFEGTTYHLGNAAVVEDPEQGLRVLIMANVDDTCTTLQDDVFTPLEPGDEVLTIQEWQLIPEGRNTQPAVDADVSVVLENSTALLRTYASGLGTPGDYIEVVPRSTMGEDISLRLTFHTKVVGQTFTPLSEPTILEASFFAEYCLPIDDR